MPISISVRTISVALLLLSSAVDIVAAPVSTTGPSQMPSTQHDERRVTAKLHARVFARRLPGKGDNGKITKHDHRQLRPGETVSICLDHVALDVVREKPNAPNSPSNSNSPKSPNSLNSSKSPNSPNSPYSGHNFPKSEKWHIEPGRNRFDNADPQILYLGQIHYDDWESKKTLLGVDVLNKLGGKKGFLFTEVIETTDSEISPGRLESHETANLVIEKLRRWSNDPEVKIEFKEEEVVHSETKEKIKVWDAYFQSTKTLNSIARWDTSKLLESVPYPDLDKLELDWDKIAEEVEARLKEQYGPKEVKYEHE